MWMLNSDSFDGKLHSGAPVFVLANTWEGILYADGVSSMRERERGIHGNEETEKWGVRDSVCLGPRQNKRGKR